ncbi:MAG: methyltransferase [Oricola sp.]|nr:methyltransferase [Oricola sp.]
MTPDASEFIRANLAPEPVPGLADIRLFSTHPGSGLTRIAGDRTPYWAYAWPGGIALAGHFGAHPDCVAGKRVLDLGAGSGLVGIAAAKAGARTVICSEIDPGGRAAIALNSEVIGVIVEIADDVTEAGVPDVDLVAAGDTFYSPAVAKRVLAYLRMCAAQGAEVLIGDIGRNDLPIAELEPVAAYSTREFGDGPNAPRRQSFVYRLA